MGQDQLTLGMGAAPAHLLPDRVRLMQPISIDAPFDDPSWFFEPVWPGIRAIVFAEGGELRMDVAGLADPLSVLPELRYLPALLRTDGVVLDGTLMVLDREGRPGPRLLRARLEGNAAPGAPAFVASDLLYRDGEDWTRRAFATRREALEAVLPDADDAMVAHGLLGEGTLLAEALGPLGIGALSARRLDGRYRPGRAGDAWVVAPIAGAPPRARPRLALIQRLPFAS